jgi:hypothetical protein
MLRRVARSHIARRPGRYAVRLRAGDSCSCVADAPHSFDNTDGKKEVLLYLVIEAG